MSGSKITNIMLDQEHYPALEIDVREKDIIQIWMYSKTDPQVVQIERENLPAIIKLLQMQLNER